MISKFGLKYTIALQIPLMILDLVDSDIQFRFYMIKPIFLKRLIHFYSEFELLTECDNQIAVLYTIF